MSFLEDLGKGINKVGKKTGVMAKVAKTKLEITKVKSTIEKKYEALGSRVYFIYKENLEEEDSVKKLLEEIDDLYESVALLELELKNSEAAQAKDLLCSNCGELLLEDAKYCGACGTKVD